MRYRAVAIGLVIDGRPVQSFSQHLPQIHEWAHVIANKHKCLVQIYETYERTVKRVKPTVNREPRGPVADLGPGPGPGLGLAKVVGICDCPEGEAATEDINTKKEN